MNSNHRCVTLRVLLGQPSKESWRSICDIFENPASEVTLDYALPHLENWSAELRAAPEYLLEPIGKRDYETFNDSRWRLVRSLNLLDRRIGDEGVRYLANGNLTGLKILDLWNNNLGSEGARHLANGNLTALKILGLWNNYLTDADVQPLRDRGIEVYI